MKKREKSLNKAPLFTPRSSLPSGPGPSKSPCPGLLQLLNPMSPTNTCVALALEERALGCESRIPVLKSQLIHDVTLDESLHLSRPLVPHLNNRKVKSDGLWEQVWDGLSSPHWGQALGPVLEILRWRQWRGQREMADRSFGTGQNQDGGVGERKTREIVAENYLGWRPIASGKERSCRGHLDFWPDAGDNLLGRTQGGGTGWGLWSSHGDTCLVHVSSRVQHAAGSREEEWASPCPSPGKGHSPGSPVLALALQSL